MPKPKYHFLIVLSKRIAEPQLFIIVLVINMLPIILFRFFPTMDGPAHLYNSNIINELLFNSKSLFHEYFAINTEPVPNWLSHFILAIVNLVLPAWLAEKCLLLTYFILLPLSFRVLIKVYNKPNLSYVIFPFTYSFLFYIGFYNFCLAFILLFFIIRYWLLNYNSNSLKFVFALAILITLTYFAHILVYSFLLLSIFVLISQKTILQYLRFGTDNQWFRYYLRKYLILLIASLPTLILLVYFFVSRDFPGNNETLDNSELFKWIKDVRPIIALVYNPELRLTEVLYHLFIGLVAITFYQRIQQIEFDSNQTVFRRIIYTFKHGLFIKKDIFLLVSLIVFLLLFNVPNGAGAGMMSDRLALMFYFFFIIWLALQVFPKWLNIISMIIIIGINMGFVYRYLLATRDLNNIVEPIYKTAEYIEPYSTVIPINYSEHWLSLHFSNYLGANKPIIVLENYEADVGWFPVCWNKDMPDNTLGGIKKDSTCIYWRASKNAEKFVDYVFIMGFKQDTTECEQKIINSFNKHYNLVHLSDKGNLRLFKRK